MHRTDRPDFGVIRIAGRDARTFLQGLISNDIHHADGSRAIYSALLSPQGKYLFDFFIVADGEALYLQTWRDDAAALAKRLSMYKLRSDVAVEDVSEDFTVRVLFGDGVATVLDGAAQRRTDAGSLMFADPRLPGAGVWILAKPGDADVDALGGETADAGAYQAHRIALGLPEQPHDLIKDKSILLESGFDELSGVDWKKGCYMGQELTARTKYRGLIKKRLVPVILDGAAAPGTDITEDGRVVGDLRSVAGTHGIAMLRLAAIRSDGLAAGDAAVRPAVPDWMRLPEPADTDAD